MGVVGEVVLVDCGQWLVEHRAEMDRAEAVWLERLADFDRDSLWALDGQLSCVAWLVWRTNMARSTAFDKLRVARELSQRPIVAEAFRDGRLSYSAVRAITRMDRPDPGVDEALVELAQSGQASIIDLERVVRSYGLYADQDRPPPEECERGRDVKILRGEGGTGQLAVTLGELEIEEFAAIWQAFLDRQYRDRPAKESSREDDVGEALVEQPTPQEIKADAFMELVRSALSYTGCGDAVGDDRYMVHLIRQAGHPATTTLDGRPIPSPDAAMVACDASTVTHTVGAGGEPLNLGRRTRHWSSSQRRAVSVRDGGRCRFVGCTNTHYDIHHLTSWEHGGPTDIANGCCQCRRHHRMLHSGYHVEGDPDHELRFYRPDGSYLGSTHSATARQPALL
jgi:hypothetical protein